MNCIDGTTHGRAHVSIAGTWKRRSQEGIDDSSDCTQWLGKQINGLVVANSDIIIYSIIHQDIPHLLNGRRIIQNQRVGIVVPIFNLLLRRAAFPTKNAVCETHKTLVSQMLKKERNAAHFGLDTRIKNGQRSFS